MNEQDRIPYATKQDLIRMKNAVNSISREILCMQDRWDNLAISDTALDKFVGKVDSKLYEFASAYADFRDSDASKKSVRTVTGVQDAGTIVQIRVCDDGIVVHTPRLIKHRLHRGSNPLAPLIRRQISAARVPELCARRLIMYVVIVYTAGTEASRTVDADNICVKAIGDPLMQAVGVDDNGYNVSLIVYTCLTDRMMPGQYVLLSPNVDRVMSAVELEQVLIRAMTVSGM